MKEALWPMFLPTTRRLRITLLLLACLAQPALAEDPPSVVMVPAECLPYWKARGPLTDDWNRVLSLATCLQDASVEETWTRSSVSSLVDRFITRLIPSLTLYATAVEGGPGPIKLRAVYHVGMAELSLIVRARLSVRAPELRPHLEELLRPSAEIAIFAFASVVQVAAKDPSMAPDPVTRYMVRNARQLLEQLATDWSDDAIRLATPEPVLTPR